MTIAPFVYAECRGWPVFPLAAGTKIPRKGTRGFRDATVDLDALAEHWRLHPADNIGLRTGAASGVFVLDVDVDHDGPASLAELEAQYAPLHTSLIVDTPSGGFHLYFAAPAGIRIGPSAGKLGAGLDVRCDDAYVVLPPSTTPKGRYRWRSEEAVLDAVLPPLPDWLTDLLRPRPAARRATPPPAVATSGRHRLDAYVRVALQSEAGAVAHAPEGNRNDQLNRSAYNLGQLVGAGVLPDYLAGQTLLTAAIVCGLPEAEAKRTILSGLNAGFAHPRSIPA